MSAVFLKLLNMSITAGWLLLAIFAARLLLKKAPRWIVCLLWALAALRLLLPFSLKSMFSLIPSAETVPADIAVSPAPAIHTGISTFNSAVNPIITETFAPEPAASVNPLQTVLFIASIVWAVGVAAMLLYALISFLRLRKTVAAAVPVGKRILLCDEVRTPFILGVFRPKICLPSSMRGETLDCVIAHETAHLKRRDHWWKPLGFLLLSVYWFHPLCWIAYILLCRDIETACDEKVIRDMDHDSKAAYSQALLDCSMQRKTITACPLAFGEAGVKQRVKGILNYKKPAFWIILIAVVVCVVIAVCLLTDPRSDADNAAIKWFDRSHDGDEDDWSLPQQITIDAYPDTVFECNYVTVQAVTAQASAELLHGMPIDSVYFSDLNGDGAPEICATVFFGSGMIDSRIRVYDYRSGASYELEERGDYDYSLNLRNGELIAEKRKYNATGWPKDGEILAVGKLELDGDTLRFVPEEGSLAAALQPFMDALNQPDMGGMTMTGYHKNPMIADGRAFSPEDLIAFIEKDESYGDVIYLDNDELQQHKTLLSQIRPENFVLEQAAARGGKDFVIYLIFESEDHEKLLEITGFGFSEETREVQGIETPYTLLLNGVEVKLDDSNWDMICELLEDGLAKNENQEATQETEEAPTIFGNFDQFLPYYSIATDGYDDYFDYFGYHCDLTGDGVPERCVSVWEGSGIVYEWIQVYDEVTGATYELNDWGRYDYRLYEQNGELLVEKRRFSGWPVDGELLAIGRLELDGKELRFVPISLEWDQNVMELLTHVYSDDELTEISQFKGTLTELGQKYPIECLREVGSGSMLYAVYRSESNVTLLYFDRNGNLLGRADRGHMAHSSEEFKALRVGDTLDDVMAFDPDGSYLWLYTGIQPPPVSMHYTTDGCIISIEYDNENVITKIEIRMI